MSITGEIDGRPTRVGYQVADLAAGLYLANGILAAVIHALKNNVGAKIQISLLDCQLAMLTWQAQNYFVSGDMPQPLGTRHAMVAPSEVFRCADGRDIAISATTEQFWKPFCAALNAPALYTDPRFATPALRIQHVAQLAAELENIFATAPCDHWVRQLEAARVPVGKVNNVAEAVKQPLATIRNMVENLPHPVSGVAMQFLGNPFKYHSSTALTYPPRLGTATRTVLRTVCGYDNERIDTLHKQGAIMVGQPESL